MREALACCQLWVGKHIATPFELTCRPIKIMSANSVSTFPLLQYLCQPIGQPDHRLVVNPLKFWQQQKVRYIERCWVMSYTPEERTH